MVLELDWQLEALAILEDGDKHKRRDGFRARLAARGSGYIRRWSTNVVMVLELDWQLEALAILEDGAQTS